MSSESDNQVKQVKQVQQFQTGDQIPSSIDQIDHFKVQGILSGKDNGQGKIFIVNEKQKIYAAKVFCKMRYYKTQIKFLKKFTNTEHVANLIYDNKAAQIVLKLNETFQKIKMPVIILELYQHGSVHQFIANSLQFHSKLKHFAIPLPIAKRLLHELLIGVQEIHTKNIYHRDLKNCNILLDEKFRLRIADFGLAEQIPNQHQKQSPSVISQKHSGLFIPFSDLSDLLSPLFMSIKVSVHIIQKNQLVLIIQDIQFFKQNIFLDLKIFQKYQQVQLKYIKYLFQNIQLYYQLNFNINKNHLLLDVQIVNQISIQKIFQNAISQLILKQLEITFNFHDKFGLSSQASFIWSWLSYYINKYLDQKYGKILEQRYNTKLISHQMRFIQQKNYMGIYLRLKNYDIFNIKQQKQGQQILGQGENDDEDDDEDEKDVEIFGKMLYRQYDDKILMQWSQVQKYDQSYGEILLKQINMAIEALYLYENKLDKI